MIENDARDGVRLVGDRLAVRASGFSIDVARALFAADDPYAFLTELLHDEGIASAIASASASIAEVLARVRKGEHVPRSALLKIANYVIRMTTRATPFGALAGIGLAPLDERTTLTLESSRRIGYESEARDANDDDPELFFNDLVVDTPARLSFHSPRDRGTNYAGVHIRNTPAVALIRAMAREGCRAGLLVGALTREFGLVEPRARALVRSLHENGVLLDRKAETPGPQAREKIDLIHTFRGALGRDVFADAAILARVAAGLARPRDLQSYVEKFMRRYEGVDRVVPLMELIDPERGIGGVPALSFGSVSAGHRRELLSAAFLAKRSEGYEVEVDDEWLAGLFALTEPPLEDLVFDLPFVVCSDSLEELHRGNYRIARAQCLPVNHAGRLLARFASALGEDGEAQFRASVCERESGDAVDADIMFVPTDKRLLIISERPRAFTHSIDVALRSGDGAMRLAIDDLFVSCDGVRFHLHSKSLGREIIPHHCSMLNTEVAAPEVVRFLSAVSDQYAPQPFHLDWRVLPPAAAFPRIRYGRVILAPAQWNIPLHEFEAHDRGAFVAALDAFARRWDLPKQFAIIETDRYLTIDRTSEIGVELLRDLAAKAKEAVTATEAFALEQGWLHGPTGPLATEIIASVRVRTSGKGKATRSAVYHVDESERHVLPGSAWTYLVLSCGRDAQDTIVRDGLRPFVAGLRERQVIESWHFLRYADDTPHLRIRLRGDGSVLVGEALAFAQEMYAAGLAFDASLRTYVRELERYGGAAGVACAESLFTVSSDAACRALSTRPGGTADRIQKAVETFLPIALALESDCGGYRRASRGNEVGQQKDPAMRPMLRELIERGTHAEPNLEVASIAQRYRDVVSGNHFDRVCASLLHLHCNRMGLDRAVEEQLRLVFGQVWRGIVSRKESRTCV